MAIYNECKVVINLNELVKARPCGVDLAEDHVENIANDLRKRMTFDSLFGQVDRAIWDYAEDCNIDLADSEECREFGFTIPKYGEISPEPGREDWLKQIEKNKKQFEMVDLEGGSWTIKVPRRKTK